MSIKVENGIPILPQLLPVAANVHLLIGMPAVPVVTAVFASVSASGELDIPWMRQLRELWCWAACARMVLYQMGQTVRQCRIAGSFLGDNCCDSACGTDCCNEDCDATDVVPIFNNFEVDADYNDATVSFSRIRSEISQDEVPVEVAIKWAGDNGGHLLIVYGWSIQNSIKRVKINDPLYGQGEIRFSDLKTYRGGRWIATWTGFRS